MCFKFTSTAVDVLRSGDMRQRRRCPAADDCRSLVNQGVVLCSLHHKEREIYAAGEVALQHRIADMSAPHRQTLALALPQVAAPHDRPPRTARKYPSARLYLITQVRNTGESRKPTKNLYEYP